MKKGARYNLILHLTLQKSNAYFYLLIVYSVYQFFTAPLSIWHI